MNVIAKVLRPFSQATDSLISHRRLFCHHPDVDFTRNRKLPLLSILLFLVTSGNSSLCKELVQFFHQSSNVPSRSALIQQRNKLLPLALWYLLRFFTHHAAHLCPQKTHWGYHLIACDGSDITSVANPSDDVSHFTVAAGKKGYNMLHISTLFDIGAHQFIDATVHSKRKANERQDFIFLAKRQHLPHNTVWIMDRGYEGYLIPFFLQLRNQYFVIRAQSPSGNNILSGLHSLPQDDEFDVSISFSLTDNRKTAKKEPDHFHYHHHLEQLQKLDPQHRSELPVSFRVICHTENGKSYYFITNLPQSKVSAAVVQQMYQLRWNIEKAYRDTKYAAALKALHSKKTELIQQEIYAKLLMYNICKLIQDLMEAATKPKEHPTRYRYQLNFTVLVQTIRKYMRFPDKKALSSAMALIQGQLVPVRPNRHSKRGTITNGPIPFNYR